MEMSVKLSDPIATVPFYRYQKSEKVAEIYYYNGDSVPEELGYGYGTPEDGDIFYIVRNWYTTHEILFKKLNERLEWGESFVKIHGKVSPSPRRVHFMGDVDVNDAEVRTHTYSSYSHTLNPWYPRIRRIRDRIHDDIGIRYDSSLLNKYRDGNDYIAYHGDREANGPLKSVATVSLGDTRRFYLKSNETGEVIKTELHAGDLAIMTGELQRTHKHTVPKQSGVGPRISITFRVLLS
jgi:alkylated DNA repair dioxygenase AlkB